MTESFGSVVRSFVQYFIAFCGRLEAANDVISRRLAGPVVSDNYVKLGDPRENSTRSREAARGGIFEFFATTSDQKIVKKSVMSSATWLKCSWV